MHADKNVTYNICITRKAARIGEILRNKEVTSMSVSSVSSTDWAALISQYASQRTNKTDTTTSSSQDLSSNLAGVTAINSDGDTLQLSEAALSAAEMFSKMDTDGDDSLSKSEFVAARPADVTEEMASTLYSSLDSDSSGAVTVTVTEYETVLANNAPSPPPPSATSTSSTTETYDEMDTNQDGIVSVTELAAAMGSTSSSSDMSASSSSDESETFDTLDTNQNGVVSAAELASASPDDVTEETARNLFNSLDSEGSGGLTQAEYTAMSNTSGTNT